MSEDGLQRKQLYLVVDTNVWVDYFLGFRPRSAEARSFMEAARLAGAQILYPIGILQDVFAILMVELKRSVQADSVISESDIHAFRHLAWGCVDAMREIACSVGADESDAWLACKYRTVNWDLEDNMVIAAAKRIQADYLVTSDKELIAKAPIAALTPADMCEVLKGAA